MISRINDTQLMKVFCYFPYEELVQIATVCKKWKQMSGENYVWKVIFANTFPDFKQSEDLNLKAQFQAIILQGREAGLPRPLCLNVTYELSDEQVKIHQIKENYTSDIPFYKGSTFSKFKFYETNIHVDTNKIASKSYWHVQRHLIAELPPLDQEVYLTLDQVSGLLIKIDGTSKRPDLKEYRFVIISYSKKEGYKIKMVKNTDPE